MQSSPAVCTCNWHNTDQQTRGYRSRGTVVTADSLWALPPKSRHHVDVRVNPLICSPGDLQCVLWYSCCQGWSVTIMCPFPSPCANTGKFAKWRITGRQKTVGKKQLHQWRFYFFITLLKSRKVGQMNNASWQWPEVRSSCPDNKAAPPSAVRCPCSNWEHKLKVQLHLTEGSSRLCQSVFSQASRSHWFPALHWAEPLKGATSTKSWTGREQEHPAKPQPPALPSSQAATVKLHSKKDKFKTTDAN